MTGAQKRRGDEAERAGAALLADLTGRPVRRLLGAGRADDMGDLDAPDLRAAVQVTSVRRAVEAPTRLRSKVVDAQAQAERAGLPGHLVLMRVHHSGRVLWRCAVGGQLADDRDFGFATTGAPDGVPAWEALVHGPEWVPWVGMWLPGSLRVAVTTPAEWWLWWQCVIHNTTTRETT